EGPAGADRDEIACDRAERAADGDRSNQCRVHDFLLNHHSSAPVTTPKATSGVRKSVSALTSQATAATAQQQAVIQIAIARAVGSRVSGSLAMRVPCCGRCWKERAPTDAEASGRSHQPRGGYRGTPSPSAIDATPIAGT